MDYTHIYKALREERDRRNLSNKDLERLTGESDSTIQRLLSGAVKDARLEPVAALCMCLGISLDSLLGLTTGDSQVIADLRRELELSQAKTEAAEEQLRAMRETCDVRLAANKDYIKWQRGIIYLLAGIVVLLIIAQAFCFVNLEAQIL